MRAYGLPEKYSAKIESTLNSINFSLSEPKRLSEVILRLSDHYQTENSVSPWTESWAKAAYLSYFFPLNYARVAAVSAEGIRQKFFAQFDHLIDYGSGLGTAVLALNDVLSQSWKEQLCYDVSSEALALGKLLAATEIKTTTHEPTQLKENSLAIFSYSLNELKEFPQQFLNAEGLMLIEPSTRHLGRKLLELRDQLITEHGFYAWAPCPHQGPCPLFNDSQKDWCHDRIAWQPSSWFSEIEKFLPIKNPTLTFSYVLLRKLPPEKKVSENIPVRVVGDPLVEKGKTRQLICFDSQRHFLSWFPQRLDRLTLEHFSFDRGDLLELKSNLEERGEEIRVKESHQVAKLI